MIRLAVVGLGKMGLSHLAMIRATTGVEVVGVCDTSDYLLGVLSKYTGVSIFSDYPQMLDMLRPDAVLISTPSKLHAQMVDEAVNRGIHVFCEKPFVLDSVYGIDLVERARSAGLVTQVGYHNRFVGTFMEVKRLLDHDAIGTITHALGEAYGAVVLKPSGSTWRSRREEGGGCLYDYAAHPLNLLNWYLGRPESVGGSVLNSIFSRDIDDEVYSTLYFPQGKTAQLSVNWSDESVRKMTTRITLWGTAGRIYADRQEMHVYLRGSSSPGGYNPGWNIKYTTELTPPVGFYLRGEEYSAQLEAFRDRIESGAVDGANDFSSALVTDQSIEQIRADGMAGGKASDLSGGRERRSAHGVRDSTHWSARARGLRDSLIEIGRRGAALLPHGMSDGRK